MWHSTAGNLCAAPSTIGNLHTAQHNWEFLRYNWESLCGSSCPRRRPVRSGFGQVWTRFSRNRCPNLPKFRACPQLGHPRTGSGRFGQGSAGTCPNLSKFRILPNLPIPARTCPPATPSGIASCGVSFAFWFCVVGGLCVSRVSRVSFVPARARPCPSVSAPLPSMIFPL